MAKKSSFSFIYLIGMALVAVGFCLPIFQFKFLGSHTVTGFDLVGDGDTEIKIFTLLIFVGAVLGVVASLVKLPQGNLIKLVALAVSIISFVIVLIMLANSDGASLIKGLNLGKKANNTIFKSLYYGAYMIFAGWLVAIAGYVTKK